MSNSGQALKQLLAERRAVRTASVGSPLSAKLAESLGYEVAMLAGSVAAIEVLASPDFVLLTATELAEQTRRLARASHLPILVDADHGYGNALNVMRTVDELVAAGAAGLTIEDTLLPWEYGPSSDRAMITLDEGLGKLRAAIEARGERDTIICARTSAAKIAGTEEAIRRVVAYESEGPDAIFLSGITDEGQLSAIMEAVSIPVILGAAGPDLCRQDVLERIGVSLFLVGHSPTVLATHAMREAYITQQKDGRGAAMKGIASDELIRELLNVDCYLKWRKDFMDSEK